MKKKIKLIIGAVKRTIKQRVCKHTYRANVNQVIDISHPIKYECMKCNKVVMEARHT